MHISEASGGGMVVGSGDVWVDIARMPAAVAALREAAEAVACRGSGRTVDTAVRQITAVADGLDQFTVAVSQRMRGSACA